MGKPDRKSGGAAPAPQTPDREKSSREDAPPGKAVPLHRALEHIKALLHGRKPPELTGDLAEIPSFRAIHEELTELRQVLQAFSHWDFTPEIESRGILPGFLKSLQSNLRLLIRRVKIIEQGDMTPQKHNLGEFSELFNHMVKQLDTTLRQLRAKEEALLSVTANLQNEVNQRNSTVQALQKSETQLRYLANHDGLTGALNRRSFMERATFELQVAISRNINCCLAIMDIDLFKQFNDRYGHLAGDEALRHLVKVVAACLRKMDFMGRYGGEEFVFFFQGANLQTGHIICDRVRKSLATTPLELESGPVCITASFGVTMTTLEEFSTPPEGLDFSVNNTDIIRDLVDKADKALYQAKKNGRNRVVSYHDALKNRSWNGPEEPEILEQEGLR
jgi:diguanylate cyclase (GGDEF)-like protein